MFGDAGLRAARRSSGCWWTLIVEPRLALITMAEPAIVRRLGRLALLVSGLLVLGSCSGSGGGSTGTVGTGATRQLTDVSFGRLVDVYGLRTTAEGPTTELFRRDVLIGRDIRDQRVPGQATENLADAAVDYDFISADADTLQSRLFIPREIGSADFNRLFDALDDELGSVTPMRFGEGASGRPYSVVPRNAAIRLTFSRPLGVTDDFFVVRDATTGLVTGLRNTEAVQLLQIGGDPEVAGNFVPLPARVVVGSDTLTLDPVLLGNEGLQYETRNNAAGLPPSPDQLGANIRIAIALDGPLAIPGMRPDTLSGLNNAGRQAIIRDFRSGNDNDSLGPDLSRGFVRDNEPPRLIGEMAMYLERVDPINDLTMQVTIFKGGIQHEIDRGDVIRFVPSALSAPIGSAEVVVDPADDLGQPGVQHVRVRVSRLQAGRDLGPAIEAIDPTNRPDFPHDPSQVEAWLIANAPRAILVAEYQGGRTDSGGNVIRQPDDPRYFGLFSPTPLPLADGTPSQPNENVSTFAGAVVRFTKPVDMRTVKSADSLFFATRNLNDQAAIDEFIATRPWRYADITGTPSGTGMDPATFREAKFRTPHLISARVLDEDASQTTLRLQPLQGFYLDQAMRQDGPRPYYLHILAGDGGIKDLAGNPLDLQTTDVSRARGLVIPFTLDMRSDGTRPFFEDNLAVYVVRRMADADEDEQPSYYLRDEVQGPGAARNARALALRDLFGSFSTVEGKLFARPTSRVRKAADDVNQAPVDPQDTILEWCPVRAAGEPQVANNTATAALGAGVQNPLNPYGCRLQTVWREIDLSLSRTDPADFNLDVEQMYWASFGGSDITFDEFDRVTLVLGHSERRPEPCVDAGFGTASMPSSGLFLTFEENYARNPRLTGTTLESQAPRQFAFASTPSNWRIEPAAVVYDPTHSNRYLPMPAFRKPYFVYRDETVREQGCTCGLGTDLSAAAMLPWLVSPWNNGIGRRFVQVGGLAQPVNGFWNSQNNFAIRAGGGEALTEGLVGNIALPLLADFLTECDLPNLPAGNGYVAQGYNGWQCAITVQTNAQPNFRVYTAGRPPFPGLGPLCRQPSSSSSGLGGFSPPPPIGFGGSTPGGDNTFYWIMIDFLRRASVVTNGFVDLYNPHRVPNGFADSRLGPYFLSPSGTVTLPTDMVPRLSHDIDPPQVLQPAGTTVQVQFRAAGAVDPQPWYWTAWGSSALYPSGTAAQLQPTASNFPLDPGKAADAHIRKFDDRLLNGVARNAWTYFYNRNVTSYVTEPNELFDDAFLRTFAGPNEGFTHRDVRYVNWRFLMANNVDAQPPVSPSIATFALAWRFQRTQ